MGMIGPVLPHGNGCRVGPVESSPDLLRLQLGLSVLEKAVRTISHMNKGRVFREDWLKAQVRAVIRVNTQLGAGPGLRLCMGSEPRLQSELALSWGQDQGSTWGQCQGSGCSSGKGSFWKRARAQCGVKIRVQAQAGISIQSGVRMRVCNRAQFIDSATDGSFWSQGSGCDQDKGLFWGSGSGSSLWPSSRLIRIHFGFRFRLQAGARVRVRP